MVSTILEMLQAGATTDEILEAYPSITESHIRSSLEFAANLAEQRFKATPV
ncbi:MAG: DUF433 domain-containing protein [archaeon]